MPQGGPSRWKQESKCGIVGDKIIGWREPRDIGHIGLASHDKDLRIPFESSEKLLEDLLLIMLLEGLNDTVPSLEWDSPGLYLPPSL